MRTKLLINCANTFEANLLKSKLDDEGIFCFLTNENFSTIMPYYYNMLGSGVRIMVNEDEYQTAVSVLKLNNIEELKCPICNSTNLKAGLGEGKFKKIFAIIMSIFMFVPINNINIRYTCKDCNNEFVK
jgi:hypothetical protein